jgi:hypothetical protein
VSRRGVSAAMTFARREAPTARSHRRPAGFLAFAGPPSALAMTPTIASPSPAPPSLRALPSSGGMKRKKECGLKPSGEARPGVGHCDRDFRAGADRREVDVPARRACP